MGSIHCEGTSVSQSYSNRIVRTVWYCKREAHMSQKFVFGLAQDKPRGMAMHRDVRVHSLRYTGKPTHCLTVAIRPLRVEELAEVLAVDFDAALKGGIPQMNMNW